MADHVEQPRLHETHFEFTDTERHALSGLPSRAVLNEVLSTALENPEKQGNLAIMFLDLDGIKGINDTEGHEGGDEYIIYAAGALQDSVREGDVVSLVTHQGGDEFVVVLGGVQDADALHIAKERIQTNLNELGISCSIGGKIHEPGMTISELLRAADEAMYLDKRARTHNRYTSQQLVAFREIGAIAAEYGLVLRDAETVISVLSEES